MSTLAVFLALAGGTALAASRLHPNSVSSQTVRDGSLRSADFADGKGVRGADVVNGSLGGADLAGSSLGGADLADGSLNGADVADGAIGPAQLGKGAAGRANLAPGAVNSANVVDGGIHGADVGTDTVTGAKISEATLGTVPDAASLANFSSHDFLAAGLSTRETPLQQGTPFGQTGFILKQGCAPGEHLLAGGAANVDPGTHIFEDAPINGVWVVGIAVPNVGVVDNFSVIAICATARS